MGARVSRKLPILLAWIVLSPAALAQMPGGCGNPFVNHFGPFDYRRAPDATKQMVENRHFTPGVEAMIRPSTTTTREMAADVAYTLHVFPNHHRALLTMMRLGEKHHSPQPPGAKFTVECYFERGVQFRPDDTVVRGLFALFLAKNGRKPEALAQMRAAEHVAEKNPIALYAIGMVYFELGEYDDALKVAHQAAAAGDPRKGLEEALRGVNRWRDALPAAEAASAPASGPTPSAAASDAASSP